MQKIVVEGNRAESVIRSLALHPVSLAEWAELSGRPEIEVPVLVVVQAGSKGHEQLRETLAAARRALPRADLIVWTSRAHVQMVRMAYRYGARRVLVADSEERLADAVRQSLENPSSGGQSAGLVAGPTRSPRFDNMLSCSAAMWDVFGQVVRVASSDATVLIIGETGTGKELVARGLHRRSGRRGRFVAFNCSSIPEHLVDSELYGYERGAFTGADRRRKGLVRHADGGTLFLDEIGDMPAPTQLSLLRMLQERTIRPIGGHEEIPVNVRIISATHVPLDQMVASGRFREDLFYRLDVIRLVLPPLRDRPEDILLLFDHFIRRLSKQYGGNRHQFDDAFLEALVSHDWPGNVRQLENFAERVVLSGKSKALSARDFVRLAQAKAAPKKRQPAPEAPLRPRAAIDLNRSLKQNIQSVARQIERAYLQSALKANRGRIAETAKQAGISRRTLLRKMITHGIDKSTYRK